MLGSQADNASGALELHSYTHPYLGRCVVITVSREEMYCGQTTRDSRHDPNGRIRSGVGFEPLIACHKEIAGTMPKRDSDSQHYSPVHSTKTNRDIDNHAPPTVL